MPTSIALFDFTHALSVAFHASANDGGPNGAVGVTMQGLHRTRDYAGHLIVCLDSPPYWRTELFPAYKGTRERLPEWHSIYRQAVEALERENHVIAKSPGHESDDVMATLAKHYAAQGHDVRILSADKDMLQCIGPNVTIDVAKPNGFESRDAAWLAASDKYGAAPAKNGKPAVSGLTPEQIPLLQANMGDKSDNIPGVAGIGPVQGAELIRKCWVPGDPLRTIGAITTAMMTVHETSQITGKVPAIVTKWLAAAGNVGTYLKLTTLCTDVPLDADALLRPQVMRARDAAATQQKDEALDAIEELFSEPPVTWLGFKQLLTPGQGVALAGIPETAPYAMELLETFRVNLTRHEQNGTPYTPAKAAAASYATTNTPGQKALSAAPGLAPKEAPPLPKAPTSTPPTQSARAATVAAASPGASTGAIASGGGADPKAPAVDAPIPPAAGVSTATPIKPASPAPAEPVLGVAHPSKKTGLALLREPFPDNLISMLPKGSKAQNECAPSEKRNCETCGGWHHPKIVHLAYAGHAAVTDRLLEADPGWSWEPLALLDGLPRYDASGGLWIRLTVCGVTRLGYGNAQAKGYSDVGAREKEVIGDALRNAAMRFGAALELWHKGDLHGRDD